MPLRSTPAVLAICVLAALSGTAKAGGGGPAISDEGIQGTAGIAPPDPAGSGAAASAPAVLAALDALYPDLEALYIDLHRNPELSLMEEKTAARMAGLLSGLGFTVTSEVGGHGLVGILRNGDGPTAMLRADLDGLPVEEKTGLPYASRVRVTREGGETVPVMHACGHDIHMTSWIGAATLLARNLDRWRGTLMMVGQPAEEVGGGARAMIEAGLLTRFPKPDAAFAIHDSAELAAGHAAWTPGYSLASADSVDVVIHGKGGHGAYPHKTVDPIVIASRFVLTLQTIVSREKSPLEPAVITVGSIQGGTKHNIIPDEVRLQLTVRAYKQEVRQRILEAIGRIARQEAAAAGAPREPEIHLAEATPATYNDPALARRIAGALEAVLGPDRIAEIPPVMGSEDFSEYGRAGIPAAIFWVGAVEPSRFEEARRTGEPLPSLHSPLFAPDRERTLKTGVQVVTVAALAILAEASSSRGEGR